MNKTMSIYLDLLRFFAAVAVFLHHLAPVTGRYSLWGSHGEDAVMVFFVLSGFVIAYVTDRKEKTPVLYLSSRLARLYSVAIPALLLTLVFDEIGRTADPALYAPWYHDSLPWLRAAASVTFTNQLWSLDIRYFGNTPYWSLSYEFWYYILFAILVFARRWWLIALWAIFVGPCILLLLPVWMAGVFVYRLSKTFTVSSAMAWAMALIPPVLYVLYGAANGKEILTAFSDSFVVPITGNEYYLHKARFFLHDYVLTGLLCVHFLGASVLCRTRQWRLGSEVIPRLAVYTFSLYLIHYPLMYCLSALSPWEASSLAHDALVVAITCVVVWLVGLLGERLKSTLRAAFLTGWTALHGFKRTGQETN